MFLQNHCRSPKNIDRKIIAHRIMEREKEREGEERETETERDRKRERDRQRQRERENQRFFKLQII